jgi:hypothetical protein
MTIEEPVLNAPSGWATFFSFYLLNHESGCRLRRVVSANRAREDVQLATADGVCATTGHLNGLLDRCRELCGVDSRHRAARAE